MADEKIYANLRDLKLDTLAIIAAIAGGLTTNTHGLCYYGVVDNVPGANQFRIPALAGLGAGKFANVGSALNPYYVYCLRDAAGAGDFPQGQQNPVTAYVTATGVFTAPGFAGGGIGVGDEVLIIHNNLSAWQLEIYTDVIALMGRLTVARAGYLDNINQAGLLQITAARAALLDQITALRLAELDAANLPADVDTLKASHARQLFSMDFWSLPQEEVAITNAAGDKSLPSITIADLPAGAVIVRAIVMLKFRTIENTNVAANKLNGVQEIQIRDDSPSAWIDAINLVDDMFGLAASTREGGDVIIGAIDVSATVDGNDTYNVQWDEALADADGINFNDAQVGLRIWYSV